MSISQNPDTGHLEQVCINKPEVTIYFSGEKTVRKKDINAYLGKEQLTLVSLERERYADEAIHYYIDLDISASVSWDRFLGIKSALKEFGKAIRPQDRITLITFGDNVEVAASMSGEEIQQTDAWVKILEPIQNDNQHTAFFEALNQTVDQMEAETRNEEKNSRNVMVVFTDGEDIAAGKTTRTEAQMRLTQEGIPLYAFTAEETAREYINSLGEFARSTGGYMEILPWGKETEGICRLQEYLLSSYRAEFAADNNVVSNEMVTVTLEDTGKAVKQQKTLLNTHWKADTEIPGLEQVERCSSSQVRVSFSEPVQGLDCAASYRFTVAKDRQTLIPAYASPASDGQSVLLTFAQPFPDGLFTLSVYDMKDRSMEQNPLEQTKAFLFEEERTWTETEYAAGAEETETVRQAETGSLSLAVAETAGFTETETPGVMETETENVAERETARLEETKTTVLAKTVATRTEENEASGPAETKMLRPGGPETVNTSELDYEGVAGSEMIIRPDAKEEGDILTDTGQEERETENESETEWFPAKEVWTDTSAEAGGGVAGWFHSLNRTHKGLAGGLLLAGFFLSILTLVLIRKRILRKKHSGNTNSYWKDIPTDMTEGKSTEKQDNQMPITGKKVTLTINDGNESFQVMVRNSIIVGRSQNCDLRFSDPTMSRQHFAIGTVGKGLAVMNLSRSGYTTLNGQRLEDGEYRLNNGDTIGAGVMRLKIAWE